MLKRFHSLIQSINTAPDIIGEHIKLVSRSEFDSKRGVNCWSIKEHLLHILLVQDIFYERLLKFLNEEIPVITPYSPPDEKIEYPDNIYTIEEILVLYRNKRNKQLELINSMDNAVLSKKAEHSEFKQYSLEILLNHMLFHDYWHMYRIEELWLTKDEYPADS